MNNTMIKQIIEEKGFILYDTEIAKENERNIFRILIKKKEANITLNECSDITKLISPIFDVEEPMKEAYFLEVSSPGIERTLSKPEHFLLSVGELVTVTTKTGEKIKGKLQSFEDNKLNVKNKIISLDNVKKARTYFEW